jgi:glycosyltransferase involved in cell wall biosynthesis
MKPVLSVFLMAYNEAGSIEATASEIIGELHSLGQPFEFIIIDDGSTDATPEKAGLIAASYENTRVVRHGSNMGLGGVYRTGFSEAEGEFMTFFPADGQFPASIIGEFFGAIKDNDMVLGYIPGRKSSVLAKVLSAVEKAVYGMLFGKLPKFQGILMFRRGLLGGFTLVSSGRGWAVLMELIIRTKRAGKRIKCMPTSMRQRGSGMSKVNNLPTIFANLKQVIALRRYL